MSDKATNEAIFEAIETVRAALVQQDRRLATLESRIIMIHEEVRSVGETVRRLKLASDNAKRLSLAHAEVLKSIESRLLGEALGRQV